MPLIERLLAGPSGPARLGAIQALGIRAGPDEQQRLQALLLDPAEDAEARATAAGALAGLGGGEVAAVLARVLRDDPDEAVIESALESLAARPWGDAEPLVRGLLADPELDPAREVAILEALSESSPEVLPLLADYAGAAATTEARLAAIESLALLDDAEAVEGALMRLAAADEAAPEVRAELYHALALHGEWEDADASRRLTEQILAETDPEARVHGYRMLASRLRGDADPGLAETFDRKLLPWLAARARDVEASHYQRRLAIDAMKLGGTPQAREVLEDLAYGRDPDVAPAAQKALDFPPLR